MIIAIKSGHLEDNKVVFDFETKECFNGALQIPMIKNFFDDYVEKRKFYLWNKKKEFHILVGKAELNDKGREKVDLNKFFKYILEEKKIYLECYEAIDDQYKDYPRNITKLRMPTAYDYLFYQLISIDLGNECLILGFMYFEKDKNKWEKIIEGILELIEIKQGDD